MKEEMESNEAANGSAWAALLAAGIGAFAFGVLTDLSEVSKAASKFLQRAYTPAGSLSGVAVGATLIWIAVWIVLHILWNKRQIQNQRFAMIVIIVLSIAAFVTTFPPFYELIGG
jgi:uncharacterized membrane protein